MLAEEAKGGATLSRHPLPLARHSSHFFYSTKANYLSSDPRAAHTLKRRTAPFASLASALSLQSAIRTQD